MFITIQKELLATLSKINSIDLTVHEVNTKVNNPTNNDKNIINPIDNNLYKN